MKTILPTLIIFLFLLTNISAQDITIFGQTALDNFDQNITTINGNLRLKSQNTSTPITDMSNLSNIQTINGNLVIEFCESLTTLNGLTNLTHIGGSLVISFNPILENINEFNPSLSIGGDVVMYNNTILSDYGGILYLSSIQGYLAIQYNPYLTSLGSFPNLQTLGGLNFYSNSDLQHIGGFPNLNVVNEDMVFEDNPSLTTIGAFSNLTTVNGTISFDNNDDFKTLNDFPALQYVDQDIIIKDNNDLRTVTNFSSLQNIDGDLIFDNNPLFRNIDPFSELHTIGGELRLEDLNNLTSFDGFASLQSAGDVFVRQNNSLVSITALSNLQTITNEYFDFRDNPSLTHINDFENLSAVGSLNFMRNDLMEDINCFSHITSVSENLMILENQNLVHLDGLSQLQTIGSHVSDDVRIRDNPSLVNVDGLLNLIDVNASFYVRNNPLLEDCCILKSILNNNVIQGFTGFDNNSTGCSSQAEILALTDCNPCIDCTDLYVDHTATGSNDGTNWANAFTKLEDALAFGVGKRIHVAKGTYKPTTTNQRGIYFDIPTNSSLLGGYINGGNSLRDPAAYPVFLSGDVDGNPNDFSGNSYHVVRVSNQSNVLVDGVTIQNGNADNASSFARSRGGGIYASEASVTFRNVRFTWNRAIYGGACFATLSQRVRFEDCEFKNNTADYASCFYHSNQTQMYIIRTKVTKNNALVRCAFESNNSLYSYIENSLFADNPSEFSNGLAFIATNRNARADIYNTTILGDTKNRSLFTAQVGFDDQLDINVYNSIIAHQNENFDKAFLAFNNNIYNLNTYNCYVQGSSVIGNSNNNLYEDTEGALVLNSDFSLDACSVGVNAGDNSFVPPASTDIEGNPRIIGIVDIGAYEAQVACRKAGPTQDESEEIEVVAYPNPTSDFLFIRTSLDKELNVSLTDILGNQIIHSNRRELDISSLPEGIYLLHIDWDENEFKTLRIVKH